MPFLRMKSAFHANSVIQGETKMIPGGRRQRSLVNALFVLLCETKQDRTKMRYRVNGGVDRVDMRFQRYLIALHVSRRQVNLGRVSVLLLVVNKRDSVPVRPPIER